MLTIVPNFKKTKEYITMAVLLFCAVVLFVISRFDGIDFPVLYQLSAIVLLSFAIWIYAVSSKVYQYEIDENGDFVITEFSRKRSKVVARLSLDKIESVVIWNKQEEIKSGIKTLYTYLGYFYKVPTLYLVCDEGVKVGIKVCYDEQLLQFLTKSATKTDNLELDEK